MLSGTFTAMKKFKPTDATTNPSLVLQAASLPQYSALVEEAITYAKSSAEYVFYVTRDLAWGFDATHVRS